MMSAWQEGGGQRRGSQGETHHLTSYQTSMAAHACNRSSWEAEASAK